MKIKHTINVMRSNHPKNHPTPICGKLFPQTSPCSYEFQLGITALKHKADQMESILFIRLSNRTGIK